MDLSEQSERMQSFYNLQYDPFGSVVDTMVFSGAGGRYEIAETIRHLLSYSHQDSVLIGPSGSGKRTLALQVLKLIEEQWRIAWIDGSETESQQEVLKEIIGQLGLGLKVELDLPSHLLVQPIIDAAALRYEQDEAFLIVVQFADRLPEAIIRLLNQFRELAPNKDSRIRQLWLSDDWQELSYFIDENNWYMHPLAPFSDTDAEQYLKDRLVASGHIGDSLFLSKDVGRLNQLAAGIPISLNEVARDYLVSSTFKTTERKFSFPITHVIAGIAALALVVVAVLYQAGESTQSATQILVNKDVESQSEIERKLAEAVAKVEAKQAEQKTNEIPVSPKEKEAVQVAPEAPLSVSELESPIVVENKPSVNSDNAKVALTASEVSPAATATNSLMAEALDEQYTLQLIALREQEKLTALLPLFKDSAQVEIVRTINQGKPWYVLIYGAYASKALASEAFANVPESLGVSEPWIRTFKSVREAQ